MKVKAAETPPQQNENNRSPEQKAYIISEKSKKIKKQKKIS